MTRQEETPIETEHKEENTQLDSTTPQIRNVWSTWSQQRLRSREIAERNVQKYPRFSSELFLLNRGWQFFERMIQTLGKHLLGSAAQVFIFGGGLGLIWVLSHLEPHGDLSMYLIPITILAMPAAVISPNNSWVDRLINLLFVGPFYGFFAWAILWYFQYPDWGYDAGWIAAEGILLVLLSYFCLKRSLRLPEGPQRVQLRRLWLFGIGTSLSALSFLGYYIGSQKAPSPGTSNMLAGTSFALFLTILIIRVYWLDGIRSRRANRAEFSSPPDHIILFEWVVPRSFNFTVTLGMLLIAQSMMFSTIYRAYRNQDEVKFRAANAIFAELPPDTEFESSTQLQSLPQSLSIEENPQFRPEVGLSDWIIFSFKPYVFPKDDMGREVLAPKWFKYFGRALIGLVIAILLTKQLNIWKQIMGYYWILLGARRSEAHHGVTDERTRQQNEMIANLTGIFNHYSIFWRWLLFYSVTAPTLSLKWRVILDPASAFYLGLERAHDWVVLRWDAAVACAAGVILLATAPIAYFTPESGAAFLAATLPSLISAALIFLLRVIVSVVPPSSYQRWIWWLLISHVVISILNYFLSLNLGDTQSFWPQVLWYAELVTIFAFPVVYLLGGDRFGRIYSPARRQIVDIDDCDVSTRRDLLEAFCDTEHRQWIIEQLTNKVHPVRSNRLQLRLITPSLLLNLVEALRAALRLVRDVCRPFIQTVPMAVSAWIGLITISIVASLTINLFIHHQVLPVEWLFAYGLDLILIVLPAISLLFIHLLYFKGEHRPLSRYAGWAVTSFVCSVTLGVSWIWWKQAQWDLLGNTGSEEIRRFSGWIIFLAFPALPFWRFFTSSAHSPLSDLEGGEVSQLSQKPNWLESALERLEDRLISSVYQRASKSRVIEPLYQDTLILCIARVVDHSFSRVKNSQWFQEERHALSRVLGEVLSKAQSDASLPSEATEELSLLLESALDTLGSLLHDLAFTNLLDDQVEEQGLQIEKQIPRPDLKIVIEALTQIARFPIPQLRGLEKGAASIALQRLLSCCDEVRSLVSDLVHSSHHVFESFPQAENANISDRMNALFTEDIVIALIQLWAQLEEREEYIKQSDELTPALEILKSLICFFEQSDDLKQNIGQLLLPTLRHPIGEKFLRMIHERAVDEERDEDANLYFEYLALSLLPTPIARAYYRLMNAHVEVNQAEHKWEESHSQRIEQERGTGEIKLGELKPRSSMDVNNSKRALRRIQSPTLVNLIENELETQRLLDQSKQERYEALYQFYFGCFAYLLCVLKDESKHAELRRYGWQSSESVQELLLVLDHLDLTGNAQKTAELLRLCFTEERAQFVELSCRERSEWREVQQICTQLLNQLISAAIDKTLTYYTWSEGAQRDEIDGYTPRELNLRGIQPQFEEMNDHQDSGSSKIKLSLGGAIRLTEAHQGVEIDYYSSLWLLNLLYSLAQADGIFKNPQQVNNKLERLTALLNRLGKLLKPFSGEEQGVIERVFDLTFNRLAVLKKMGEENVDTLGGKGTIDFEYTFQRVEAYLDTLEKRRRGELKLLSMIGLPPKMKFSFLMNVEQTEQGELRTYVSESGIPEVILGERVWS